MDLNPIAIAVPEKTEMSRVRLEIQKLLDTPKKRRGKQPRFPLADIRAAVLEWEQRDPTFSVETLEDFLGRKFGYGSDGILLMSVSTFYDWRRRIRKELDPHRPSANETGRSPAILPPEPSARISNSSS
jgi:transposase